MEYFALIPLGLAGIIIIVYIYSQIKDKKIAEQWELMAGESGFSYKKEDSRIIREYDFFETFSKGRSRSARNILRGENGDINICIVDYRYTTGSGKSSKTHYYTICIFESPDLTIPKSYMRRQLPFFDYLGKMFGGQDIDFDSDPEFSQAFVLQGDNEKEIRNFFDTKVRQGFVGYKKLDFVFEGNGNKFLIHKGERILPEELLSLLKDAYEIVDFLKK